MVKETTAHEYSSQKQFNTAHGNYLQQKVAEKNIFASIIDTNQRTGTRLLVSCPDPQYGARTAEGGSGE